MRFDARGNAVMEYRYGIHGEKGYTKSMDAGERWMMLAVDGQALYTWDSRKHRLHATFDELRRPSEQWLLNDYTQSGSEVLVGKTEYGESATNPTVNNLRGKPWKAYDQSGLTESVAYDFKGNLLESRRQFTTVYNATIDWSGSPALDAETFTTLTAYDALNRATSIKTPHNTSILASEVLPSYNEASLLETVNVKLRGVAAATNFVSNIDYDAKGQRERIQYGNGATTRYSYDSKTFRLTQLYTTRNSGVDILQDLNYSYDPVGNITQIVDKAQQTVFFNGSVVSPNQTFEYDALYRLTKATGREHASLSDTTPLPPSLDNYTGDFSSSLMREDGQALARYTREWTYDAVGNIVDLIHHANSGNNWIRHYSCEANSNRLTKTAIGSTEYSYAHNVHGSMTAMPHLSAMDWDYAERLSHVTRGTSEAYYNFDGSGQRVRKIVVKGNISEERLYLGGFEIYRKSVNGVLDMERETLHVMDDKKRIALVETLTVENGSAVTNLTVVQRYQLDNHLGSASLELDETASVVSYEEYYPYGDTCYQAGRSASEVSQKRYRYTGKEKDEESGLYYHGARYYACWLGRWTASDPIGLQGGINLYAYVSGNPVRLNDPKGTSENEFNSMQVTTNPDGSQSIHAMKGRASGFFSPDASAVQAPNPSNTSSGPQLIQGPGPGLRERFDKEGGPIALIFKIGYDIADEAYVIAQKAAGYGDETFRLSGEHALNSDAQDALVNTLTLFIFSGGSSSGRVAEGFADDAAKAMAKESPKSVPMQLGKEPVFEINVPIGDVIGVTNPIPSRGARVIATDFAEGSHLAKPTMSEAWVTGADDLSGMTTSKEVAQRLTLIDETGAYLNGPFTVIEFDLPMEGIASPILRDNPGFVSPGTGLTKGGAREFVVPNRRIDDLNNVTKRGLK